ncbi:MAG: GTPase Era [Candidatus Roizmanbacteria bacterium GW2011_GWC2_34_23]|uniref:GTPase Era n=2 Tax=Candidatus Roizmaniibacteriota TaxID=1752723 RepID=A0A0G0BDF2_9BACT|nr:MAG: GTPase Era [Candidatus Roizmanbacteria bacterium GW2011_GWC2_34_23]
MAITSPKPQTTRFSIRALYEEERGKIIFVDTPGIVGKAKDYLSKRINEKTLQILNENVDVVIYMVDATRKRDFEESKVLGLVRKIKKPKILVINKIDDPGKSFLPQYKFLEEEFKDVFQISAINNMHIKPLLEKIFEYLPEKNIDSEKLPPDLVYPIINLDSKIFLGELIREKIFLMMGEEIPYTTTVIVDQIAERKNGTTYIKARILTTNDRYKGMLIGAGGRKIKEIGSYARKEIALAINKKVFLDLNIEVDSHWQEMYY